ncbi:MAG TPA: aldo/keto reductase family oxidoreductase [Rhodothermales bacterium]|nr:aldo/keto reductase family oxidoreductase [Rhodothermales bacterium]
MTPVSRIKMAPGGPTFSRLTLGLCRLAEWEMSSDDLVRLIHTCLDRGLTTFDHADIYGEYRCERLFGEALAQLPGLRERMQLVTKCGIRLVSDAFPETTIQHYDTRRTHIIAAAERSLQALRTDRLDMLLIHRSDPLMDADEVAEAFTRLHESGKVLHFGVSNFLPHQFDLLASRLPFPLMTNQVECSVLHMDALHDGTLDQCQQLRIAPMAWSPFGGGRLFTGDDEQAVRVRQALQDIGDELGGASMDQVALAWLLKHPSNILPIIGTGRWDRIEQAMGAEALDLTRDQWFTLWTASTGAGVP